MSENAFDNAGNMGSATLTFTVDNTPPSLTGNLTPEQVVAGRELKITVNSSPDTSRVTATLYDQRIDLNSVSGIWTTSYTIPLNTTSGWDIVTLEALDIVGNHGQAYAYYLVTATEDNTGGSNGPIINVGTTGQGSTNNIHTGTSGSGQSNTVNINTGLMDIIGDLKSLLGGFGLGSFVSGNPPSTTSSYYGPFESILKSPYNPLSGYFQYLEDHYRYNGVKGGVTDPIGFFSYIPQKFSEGWQKYQETGNIWDFLNYPYMHMYGYSNLDETWGGQNIKEALYYFGGIERNGDMSLLSLLLLLTIFIPTRIGGRVINIGKNALTGILERIGIKSFNFGGNTLIRQVYNAFKYIAFKYDLKPEMIKEVFSLVTEFANSNIFGLATRILEGVTKFKSFDALDSVFSAFFTKLNNYQLLLGISDITYLSSLTPEERDKEVITSLDRTWQLIIENTQYIVDSVKNTVQPVVNAVKTVVNTVVNTVKKVAAKVVSTVKKVVSKVVSTVKQVINVAKNIFSSVVNGLKGILGWH